jgi:UDP-N-acetylglucosamine 2-epimerase (non-hydrolysing)
MSKALKLLVVAGARPNFMKVAPLLRAAQNGDVSTSGHHSFQCRLVHTGQHYDLTMSDVFFKELGLPQPDINLDAGSGSHAIQTAKVMARFDPVCAEEKPDWVVVVGDVNSTMACTLVCAKRGIKVAHIEAGLRSFDRTMPEEVNRVVTDALADLLLTPSLDAGENLHREGILKSKVRLVGNIMIDSLVANLSSARKSNILPAHGLQGKAFAYVTLHRPSNVDDPESLRAIIAELRRLARHVPVVFPLHPRTRKMCAHFRISLSDHEGVKFLGPLGYHDSLCLTENARLVLTDSGGLQEESTYFRTPCLTLRDTTERPVTISMGSNKLTSLETLRSDLDGIFGREPRFGEVPPLWDGHTSERVLCALAEEYQPRGGNPPGNNDPIPEKVLDTQSAFH